MVQALVLVLESMIVLFLLRLKKLYVEKFGADQHGVEFMNANRDAMIGALAAQFPDGPTDEHLQFIGNLEPSEAAIAAAKGRVQQQQQRQQQQQQQASSNDATLKLIQQMQVDQYKFMNEVQKQLQSQQAELQKQQARPPPLPAPVNSLPIPPPPIHPYASGYPFYAPPTNVGTAASAVSSDMMAQQNWFLPPPQFRHQMPMYAPVPVPVAATAAAPNVTTATATANASGNSSCSSSSFSSSSSSSCSSASSVLTFEQERIFKEAQAVVKRSLPDKLDKKAREAIVEGKFVPASF
jgi:hypothetical protein